MLQFQRHEWYEVKVIIEATVSTPNPDYWSIKDLPLFTGRDIENSVFKITFSDDKIFYNLFASEWDWTPAAGRASGENIDVTRGSYCSTLTVKDIRLARWLGTNHRNQRRN